jgi:hypothetical protein
MARPKASMVDDFGLRDPPITLANALFEHSASLAQRE